ncbi:MAG: hypothetical protein QG588_1269 [Candidatus Poribacteria bacterium]|nr:hypothetical protein [Candidatus Poribacteria bacterium]
MSDELQAHIEEYKSTQEVLHTRYQVEHNIHYWSFILLSVSIPASFQLYGKSNYKYFLLITPIPFYLLALMLLRNDLIIAANAKYYNKTLRPKVEKIVGHQVWAREDAISSTRKGGFNLFLGVCRYGTTMISFPIFILIYFKSQNSLLSNDWYGNGLLFINIVAFIFISSNIYRVKKAVEDIVN